MTNARTVGSLATAAVVFGCSAPPRTEPVQPTTIEKVDLGDYEVVEDWLKPLPDDDLSHDGWTWGKTTSTGRAVVGPECTLALSGTRTRSSATVCS